MSAPQGWQVGVYSALVRNMNMVQRSRRNGPGRLAQGFFPGLARALIAGALLAALSSGCGVRGSLEAPPSAPTETGNATPGTPGQPSPHKPSILDPLLR